MKEKNENEEKETVESQIEKLGEYSEEIKTLGGENIAMIETLKYNKEKIKNLQNQISKLCSEIKSRKKEL